MKITQIPVRQQTCLGQVEAEGVPTAWHYCSDNQQMRANGRSMATVLADELEAVVSRCNQCGHCVRECGFLQHYGNPAELGQKLKQAGLPPEVVFSCNLCGLCSAVCPQHLDPAHLFWLVRCLKSAAGRLVHSRHRTILRYERIGLSRRFSLLALPAACRSVFFPGCTLVGSRPAQVQKLFSRLQRLRPGIGLVLHCCAKPSHDLGRLSSFQAAFGDLTTRLFERGVQTVITACPSCHQIFSRYGGSLGVTSVYQVIETSRRCSPHIDRVAVTVHDPCTVRGETGMQRSVRTLLQHMGAEVAEMEHHGDTAYCCGEGGAACFVAEELAGQWAGKRCQENGGRHVITYCAGCSGRLGRSMAASHIIDFLFTPERVLAGQIKVSRAPLTYLNRLLFKATYTSLARSARDTIRK